MEVSLYHVTQSPLEKILPRLLEKVRASDKRVVVLLENQERIDSWSHTLWIYAQQSFLAHGSQKEGRAEYQPIWLTHKLENPNKSQVLVLVEGGDASESLGVFERCVDIYNAKDDHAVSLAKQRQIQYEENGFKVTHWSQDKSGRWTNEPI